MRKPSARFFRCFIKANCLKMEINMITLTKFILSDYTIV